MSIQIQISEALERRSSPARCGVENESHKHNVPPNSETHFKVTLVSDAFESQRSVRRHQAVYAVLGDWLAGPCTRWPAYCARGVGFASGEVPDSPDCRGHWQVTSSGAQSDRVVAALYRFVLLDDFADLKPRA